MKKLKSLTFNTLVVLLSGMLLLLSGCNKDEDKPKDKLDMLLKTWVFSSFEGISDPTDDFELEKLFDGFEITFTFDRSGMATEGSYSYVSPNNPDDTSGSGTFSTSGPANDFNAIILDGGSAEEQLLTLLLLTSSQLNVSFDEGQLGVIEMRMTAK